MTEENHSSDEAEIRYIFAQLEEAWNRHDMKSFASVFNDDAVFVNVAGMLWKGKEEIEAMHAKAHESQFQESILELEKLMIRFIRPGCRHCSCGLRYWGRQES